MPRSVAILILAAGASSRMGDRDKLLEPVDGTPLILRAVRAACAVSDEVIVALPPASTRSAWLGDSPATLIEVPDRAMSASLRAGVGRVRSEAVLIHLADMPEIDAAAFQTLVRAWQTCETPILRATSADGRPGQPVVFDHSLFAALTALSGDTGAKPLLSEHPVTTVALPGEAALIDLDTPEDWDVWRRQTGR